MGQRKRSERGPTVSYRTVVFTNQLISVEVLQVAHPSSHIEAAGQGLHAVQGVVICHVSQVCGASLRVVERHGDQALVLAVEAS